MFLERKLVTVQNAEKDKEKSNTGKALFLGFHGQESETIPS